MRGTAEVVVVAGGYRTGSTLQYNLLGRFLEETGQGRRVGLVDPDDVAAIIVPRLGGEQLLVAKSHHIAEGFGRFHDESAWRRLVEAGVAAPITTVRADADKRASMCRKFGLAPDTLEASTSWRVDQANALVWAELGAFEQTYDELTERPIRALGRLVEHFDLEWEPVAAVKAVRDTTVSAGLKIMETLRRGDSDPVSLIHWDHISEHTAHTGQH